MSGTHFGWLLDPTPATAANTIVNGGFESGLYQWAPCINPDKVTITAETAQPGVAPATGRRYGKFVSATGVGYACQRFAYATNGLGNQRITVTAKVRSAQPVPLTFTIDQQGNPAQGAVYMLATTQTTLTGGPWTNVTATMCEQTSANKVISAYFGTTAVATPIYIDDVSATVVPDDRPFIPGSVATSGYTPNPGVVGDPGNPVTPQPPSVPGEGSHLFQNGVPTTLDYAIDSKRCIGITAGVASLTTDRAACVVVIPTEYGPGFYLATDLQGTQCFGKVAIGGAVGLSPCRTTTGMIRDDALITDSPGQVGFAFPIRKAKLTGSPPEDYDKCLTAVEQSVLFAPCTATPYTNQMWYDAPSIDALVKSAPNGKPLNMTANEAEVWSKLEEEYPAIKAQIDDWRNQAPPTSISTNKPYTGHLAQLPVPPTLFGRVLQEVLKYCLSKCIGVTFGVINFAHWAVQLDLQTRVSGELECKVPNAGGRADVVEGLCSHPLSVGEVKPDTTFSLNAGKIQVSNYSQRLTAAFNYSVPVGTGPPWPQGTNIPTFTKIITYRNAGNGVFAYDFDAQKLVPILSTYLLVDTYRAIAKKWKRLVRLDTNPNLDGYIGGGQIVLAVQEFQKLGYSAFLVLCEIIRVFSDPAVVNAVALAVGAAAAAYIAYLIVIALLPVGL